MSADRLVFIVVELEKFWKKIKEEFNLKNVDCSLTLKVEKDLITLN